MGTLPRNRLVEIVGSQGRWLAIEYLDATAYVHRDYIQAVESSKCLKGRVRAETLNVRNMPSLGGAILGTLYGNTFINIVDTSGDWLEIRYQGTTAYVHKAYVELFEGGEMGKGVVTAGELNVRNEPSIGANISGSLARGAVIEIVSSVDEWLEIRFNGSTAFVHSDYVDMTGTSEEPRFFCRSKELKDIKLVPEKKMPEVGTAEEVKAARTWNSFGNLLAHVSKAIGINTSCAISVLCVESGGRGFSSTGQMIIRFENHHFWKWWGKFNREIFGRYFDFSDERPWEGHVFRTAENEKWKGFHGNQKREWEVLEFARSLDDTAALKSISMGAPQILGSNHERIGYRSVQEMFLSFNDIRYQVLGFFDFMDRAMVEALRDLDFVNFARRYNGQGQAETYAAWMERHYEACKAKVPS